MKITVRLYRTTDLDLIGLACADGMSVSKELKKCLVSFVRGMPYSINLNPIDVSSIIMTKKAITLQFYLEPKSYNDVIIWLKTLRTRQRNSFLKNLLRSSLPCPYLYMYQTNPTLVNNMITDIYDNQIAISNDITEEVYASPDNTLKSINKSEIKIEETKHTKIVDKTKIVDNKECDIVDKPFTQIENTSTNTIPSIENKLQETTNVEEVDSSITNNYDAEAEDALFDALFNL